MLTELTPAQWADVEAAREATLRRALLDGVPLDEFQAAAAICYAAIGEAAPAVIVAPSPIVALAWSAILLGDQLGGQLRGQLYGQLDGQLGDQLYDQLGGQLDGQLYGQLGGQLGDQLYGQLGGQLRGQLYGQLGGQLVHWSDWRTAWVSHWLHVNTIDGITPASAEVVGTLTAYQTFCAPIFTIPLRGVVIGLGPHVACHMTDRQLHHDSGPAISWVDGYSIYAWRGQRVPQWVIEDCTLDKIAAEENTEIRRCAIERYGWDRYLADVGAYPIDTADDPGNPGHTLELFDVPDDVYDGDVRLLVMRNASRDRDGSRRTFAETVPASCHTAVDAAAWQFDVDPDVYRQLARAT